MPQSVAPIRIAMWSGPRNISTAMMRSWGNRPDTAVCDEPFYAHYLQVTGYDHPGADEVIASGETDWRKVVARLTGAAPAGKHIFYQKQMTHHLLPDIDRAWLGAVTNCFLIRDPREVITSYIKKNQDPALEDLGFVQQAEIFEWVREHTNAIPPVVDARDVLENPERMLRSLCHAVGVEFTEAMLSWPPGARDRRRLGEVLVPGGGGVHFLSPVRGEAGGSAGTFARGLREVSGSLRTASRAPIAMKGRHPERSRGSR